MRPDLVHPTIHRPSGKRLNGLGVGDRRIRSYRTLAPAFLDPIVWIASQPKDRYATTVGRDHSVKPPLPGHPHVKTLVRNRTPVPAIQNLNSDVLRSGLCSA